MGEEKKEAFRKPALILGLAFLALGCTLGISSLSWFASPQTSASIDGIKGEATGSYFSNVNGDKALGTKDYPYGIENAKQLYYFAWLQDMGYFNEDKDGNGKIDQQYYFVLMNDIDADGYVLPPCGIEKYPFLGNFDGNNCTITNLTVSNRIAPDYIKDYPSMLDDTTNTRLTLTEFNGDSQAEIVGFFGIIGQYNNVPSGDSPYSSDINAVKNLYLDEFTIKTNKSNLLVGIFAGYANGIIDNCGVHYATFNINGGTSKITDFTKVSEYTLLGSYNKTKYRWDEDSSSGGGTDTGYGTSTDIKSLHLSLIDNGLKDSTGTIGQIGTKVALPFRYENKTLIQGTGSTTSVTKYGSTTMTVNPSEYSTYKASTKGNNLGYYSGALQTVEKNLTYEKSDFGVQSGATNWYLKTPPDNVLEYLQTKGTHLVQFTSAVSSDNLRAGSFNYIENAQVGDWTGNLLIPANGIWVAPKENGTFRFVFYNEDYATTGSGTVGLLYVSMQRTTPGDYSTAFVSNYLQGSGIPYSNSKYGYFEVSASTNFEYFIGYYKISSNAKSPYIAYMDIGAESGDGEDTPTDTRTLISNFDFVTKENNVLTKIKNADGSDITGNTYTKSNIFFEIEDTTATRTFSWRRTTVDNEVIVLYYDSLTPTVVTPQGTGNKNEAADGNCNGKKTTST